MADNKHIFIVGPTASGKSEIAHRLALKTGFPIVSADSRQVYKYLDIGTAKPLESYQKEVRYYNLSLLDPKETDNAQEFKLRFQQWESTSKTPFIVVGGSTLYQQALLWGLNEIPTVGPSISEQLEKELHQNGIQVLFNELNASDPIYASKMDGFNTQRILRALSVIRQTGKPFSSFHTQSFQNPANWFVVYPVIEREQLKKRIALRISKMMELGLEKEVLHLLNNGYSFNDPGLNSIGYQEWKEKFELNYSLEWVNNRINTNTWRYAKRQVIWLKRWNFLHHYDTDEHRLSTTVHKIFEDYTAFQQE